MKKMLAILLALLVLSGCAAQPVAEEPKAADTAPTTETKVPSETETPEETVTSAEASAEEPIRLGEFSAETLTGETLDQTWFANADLTVINVWATYCGPCKTEMPILGALDKELENVQILGVVTDVIDQNANPDPAQISLAQDLLTAYECEYPNLILNQSLAYLGFASLQAVPATLFVDRDGYLVGPGFYGALDEAAWRLTIEERLEMALS